jgi:carbamoyltransferase
MEPGEDSPYMLFVAPVRENWRRPLSDEDLKQMQSENINERVSVPRSTIPAITHVDYSARVQTVDEVRHGRFYRLMRQFHQKTGCPVIVNTSFNIRGEPIVCTPEDAFRCFMATDMDTLVLENHILSKTDQPDALHQDAERYRNQYELD